MDDAKSAQNYIPRGANSLAKTVMRVILMGFLGRDLLQTDKVLHLYHQNNSLKLSNLDAVEWIREKM